MLSRKIFENLHSVMTILVLLGQVLTQIVAYLNFLLLILRSLPNTGMMQFFRTFSISVYRYKKSLGIIAVEEVRNYGKLVFIKSIVEKGPPPLDPALTHLVTVGTEIAAPHKQQVPVAAVQLRFHLNLSKHRL